MNIIDIVITEYKLHILTVDHMSIKDIFASEYELHILTGGNISIEYSTVYCGRSVQIAHFISWHILIQLHILTVAHIPNEFKMLPLFWL